jgi:hypothetical protein
MVGRAFRLLLILLICAVSCTSDKQFVANAVASQMWEESRYEQRCVVKVGPADCLQNEADSNELKRQVALANSIQKVSVGKLPKAEKAQITAQVKKLGAYQ